MHSIPQKPQTRKGSRGGVDASDTLSQFFGTVMGSATQQNLAEAARSFHAEQFGNVSVPPERQTPLLKSLLCLCAAHSTPATA